ncbi:hypothetical protein J6590_058431 [Homalodisca vitripennis]|nr:hypothetical protein J6590_058431 [Homalodisca vitripennis]
MSRKMLLCTQVASLYCGTPTYLEYPLKTSSTLRILAWKPLIALHFRLGLILAYAQRARTYLAVWILDLFRVPVQISFFGAKYTLCKAGPAASLVLALQHPVTDRVHRNHTESLSHFKAGPFPMRAAEKVQPEVAVATQKHCEVVFHLNMPPFYPRLDLFDMSGSPTSMGVLLSAVLPLLVCMRALLSPCRFHLVADKLPAEQLDTGARLAIAIMAFL